MRPCTSAEPAGPAYAVRSAIGTSGERRRRRTGWGGTLLGLLEDKERLTCWESLPSAAREQVVDQLVRMRLRVVEAESSNETGNADPDAAPLTAGAGVHPAVDAGAGCQCPMSLDQGSS